MKEGKVQQRGELLTFAEWKVYSPFQISIHGRPAELVTDGGLGIMRSQLTQEHLGWRGTKWRVQVGKLVTRTASVHD